MAPRGHHRQPAESRPVAVDHDPGEPVLPDHMKTMNRQDAKFA
jgi:hypothetical protein